MLIVTEVSVSESPVFMVTEALSGMEPSNVPDVDADHPEVSVSTSPLVPAQDSHAGWLLAATDPADGEPHVMDSRVVTLETFAVPFGPGAPVCSCSHAQLLTIVVSAAFAFAADSPSAMSAVLRYGDDLLAALPARAGPVGRRLA
jgi:hypothetical protein